MTQTLNATASGEELDAEGFQRLLITARAVAVVRPNNLVRYAEQEPAAGSESTLTKGT